MKFEQFENWKQNKSEQKENFHANKSPKQNGSSHWLEPKKIFHKKCEQEIQQSQTDEEYNSVQAGGNTAVGGETRSPRQE
ncbi:MAG TPA: hypothetical protein PLB11_13710, partial [Flavobacterium sp.]|nr:hypothetical protein [Flavobacterium sp.]